ncbi:MAG: TlpA disulfide reductase family protein [Pirellulales bacterium]
MSISSSSFRPWTLSLALACGGWQFAVAAEPDKSDAAEVVVSDSADFTVPDGDAAVLLAFIEKLANPQEQFTSEEELQKYLDGVSTAIGAAADKVLAGKATDRQLIDAIEWKIESLRIRHKLGDDDADQQTDAFLASLKFDGQPTVEEAIKKIRQGVEDERQNRAAMQQQMELMTKLRQWQRLDAAQHTETTDWLINVVKSDKPNGVHASMLTMFVDALSGTPDSELAKKALGELLPVLSESDNPEIEQRLPMLEGINRRLNLPGNKLELSGKFLDGAELDWDSYRGKVVLVDYWATWCGPCRAEVPNVLENYLKYHDKGFDVVGISLDDKRSDAEDYVKQTNIPWPSLFHEASDQSGWQNPMAVKYGITGIPTAILVDQEGNVVSMQARGPRLGAALEKLLGKPSGEETSAVEISDQSKQTAQSEAR